MWIPWKIDSQLCWMRPNSRPGLIEDHYFCQCFNDHLFEVLRGGTLPELLHVQKDQVSIPILDNVRVYGHPQSGVHGSWFLATNANELGPLYYIPNLGEQAWSSIKKNAPVLNLNFLVKRPNNNRKMLFKVNLIHGALYCRVIGTQI